MLDRIPKLIVTLTLLLFLVQALIGVLARVLETEATGAVSMLASGGGLVQLLAAVVAVSFVVGLLIRFIYWLGGKGPRDQRRNGRGAHDWASRTLADEVPAGHENRQPRSPGRRRN